MTNDFVLISMCKMTMELKRFRDGALGSSLKDLSVVKSKYQSERFHFICWHIYSIISLTGNTKI